MRHLTLILIVSFACLSIVAVPIQSQIQWCLTGCCTEDLNPGPVVRSGGESIALADNCLKSSDSSDDDNVGDGSAGNSCAKPCVSIDSLSHSQCRPYDIQQDISIPVNDIAISFIIYDQPLFTSSFRADYSHVAPLHSWLHIKKSIELSI